MLIMIAYASEEIKEVTCSCIMRKRYPQIMWGFQSWWAFHNTQARDLMGLSDDEKATLSNFFS